MNEFWSAVVSGTAADILGRVISVLFGVVVAALVPWFTRKSKWKTGAAKSRSSGAGQGSSVQGGINHGAQVLVEGENSGSIHIEQDHSRHVVIQNIDRSGPPRSSSSNPGGSNDQATIIAICVLSLGLFIALQDLVFWFSIGAALGLAVTLIAAATKAIRLKLWGWLEWGALAEALISLAAVVIAWYGVFNNVWRGHHVTELVGIARRGAPAGQHGAQSGTPWIQMVTDFLDNVVRLAKTDFPYGIGMVLLAVLAVMGAGAMLFRAWRTLLDWMAYTGFAAGTASSRLVVKAQRFESRTASAVMAHILLAALICAISLGAVYALMTMSPSLPGLKG